MILRKKLILALVAACVSVGLTACGNDDDGNSTNGLAGLGGTNAVDDAGQSGATDDLSLDGGEASSSANEAHTIVLTYPITESVENLGGGIYRRIGKAIVTDRNGEPVPDGTKVYINVIDSVIAKGTISSADGDSISGSVLVDNNSTLADGTLTTLDTAYVIRNEAYHFIRGGDHVLLKGTNGSEDANNAPNAEPMDKNRIIASEDGAVAGNALTVTQAYTIDYPNDIYDSGVTDYVVGASLLGAKVFGVDTDVSENTASAGYATTKDGIAEFFVTYPANNREINSGCISEQVDERSLPLGSAQVMLIARSGTEAITLDDRFCFAPMAPYVLTHEPDWDMAPGTSLTDARVLVTLEDANKIKGTSKNTRLSGIMSEISFYWKPKCNQASLI